MSTDATAPPESPSAGEARPEGSERDQISQNLAAVTDFYAREEQRISFSQHATEQLSCFIGRPVFLGLVLLFVVLWACSNSVLQALHLAQFDPAPYFWLQGIVGLTALLTTTVVLIKQNRLEKLAEQRAHLDLKVTLLTEQKAAKLIDLIEELRRDLPSVRDRHDSDASALQQAMNPELVLAALDERRDSGGKPKPLAPGKATS